MGLQRRNLKNNWSTTLQADAAAAATTLSILQAWLDKLVSPAPSSTEWYMLTLDDGVQAPEIVRCTGKGTGTATVLRAQEGTTAPTTWAAGTKVEIRPTAALLRVLEGAQYDATIQALVIGADGAGHAFAAGAYGTTMIGRGAGYELTTGNSNTALGDGAFYQEDTGNGNTAIGANTLGVYGGNNSNNVALGRNAGNNPGTGVNRSTYVGAYADNGTYNIGDVLCLGYGALAYTANTAVMGSENSRLSEVYIGGGQRDQAAAQVTLSASAGSGTNKAGGTLRLGGGKGTGTGAGGKVIIATAPTGGASGTTEATWTDRAEIDNTGLVWAYGDVKTGDPGSGAATWRLGAVQAGAVTLDSANYVEVKIGGAVVKLLKAA